MSYLTWVLLALTLNCILHAKVPILKYILTPIAGLTLALSSLIVSPIGMLFAVWFIKWDNTPTNGSYNQNPTIRGDLPYLLKWFQTPDERFPGGLYEPTVKNWLNTQGKYICSYKWAGLRNQLMGLAAALGCPTTDYIPESPLGFWERGNIWRYTKVLGPIKVVLGWQVYRRLDLTFLAVPVFTLKNFK